MKELEQKSLSTLKRGISFNGVLIGTDKSKAVKYVDK